jgi:hypothetical protein
VQVVPQVMQAARQAAMVDLAVEQLRMQLEEGSGKVDRQGVSAAASALSSMKPQLEVRRATVCCLKNGLT